MGSQYPSVDHGRLRLAMSHSPGHEGEEDGRTTRMMAIDYACYIVHQRFRSEYEYWPIRLFFCKYHESRLFG